MRFCEKIKKIRVDNNLTQEEMAKKLFVSRSLIAKWEQDRGIPSIDMLNNIATILGLQVNDLITEEEIKLITLKNNQEVETNKKHLKTSIIIGVISILVLVLIIFFIIIRINLNNDIKPVFQDFETRGEIIGLKDNIVIVSDKKHQYEINWRMLEKKLDRYENEIDYDFLKIGHYVDISGLYNVTYDEYTFNELTVVEEYLDDYIIYGIVITLDDIIPTSIPLWGTSLDNNSFSDRPSDDAYPRFLSSFGMDNVQGNNFKDKPFEYTYSRLEYKNEYVGIEYEVSISVSLDKKVNIFVIDNSEKGFALYQSVNAALVYSKRTQVDISGYLFSDTLRQSDSDRFYIYSHKVNYKINILHEYPPKKYTIYEYDANNQLINETSFSTLEDFWDGFKKLEIKEETLYCIVKKFGLKSSKKVYLGEEYSFELIDRFGYIYKFDYILR